MKRYKSIRINELYSKHIVKKFCVRARRQFKNPQMNPWRGQLNLLVSSVNIPEEDINVKSCV
jgi:hypothetical protein